MGTSLVRVTAPAATIRHAQQYAYTALAPIQFKGR